jgi:hypothetical protein
MAFLLVLAMVAFWSIAGWVLLHWTGMHRNLLRTLLLAPAAGVVVLVLPLFELYRWGVPMRIGAPVATVAICAGIGAYFFRNRRRKLPPARLVAQVGLVLALGGAFVGAPLLKEGFAWVSFCNDDMANYVLSAQGLVSRGFLAPYAPMAYIANGDPSLQWTAVFDAAGLRCGAELLLAWAMVLVGFEDHRVFMPVIIGLQMVLVGAAAGLVCTGRGRRKQAWLVMAWLPAVALVVLGAVYQLIAQVNGLGLLALCAAVLLDRARHSPRTAVLGGLLVAAFGVSYPEAMPFLALGVLLHYRLGLAAHWRWFGTIIGIAIVLWNTYFTGLVHYFQVQLNNGANATPARQFPYFLIPSGLPTFWGLMPIAGRLEGVWMDLAIAAGMLLMAAAAYSIASQYRRGEPVGTMALSFGSVAVLLFAREADFGVYKASMYLWPFLAGVLILTWWQWLESRRFVGLALTTAMVSLLALPTCWSYISASAGWGGKASGFVEIPRATESALVDQLRRLSEQPRERTVVTDTYNVVLAKFEALYFPGESFRTPSKNFFATSGRYLNTRLTNWYAELVRPGFTESFAALLQQRRAWYPDMDFPMPQGAANRFQLEQQPGEVAFLQRYTLLRSGRDLTVLNRASALEPGGVSLQPGTEVRNHLLLTDSHLGRNYYLADTARPQGRVALFQLEPDYFRPGQTMASAGRHMLFQVLGPVTGSQMQLEVTASLNGDGQNWVPPAAVVGGGTFSLGALGRGSARLQTAVEPAFIERRPFLLLDMGTAPRGFQEERRGLLSWYGQENPLDNRKITSFVRNISLVTGTPEPPAYLEDFRAGLRNPAVLYSGSYEDGWIAEESYFRLRQPAGEMVLAIRVNVPDVPARPQTMTVRVDDDAPETLPLRLGRQEISLPMKALSTATAKRVQLTFDRATPLSAGDRRPASVLMEALGFRAPDAAPPASRREIPVSGLSLGVHWHPFEEFGGAVFRWVEREAEIFIPSSSAGKGKLTLELEAGPGVGSKAFRLQITDDAGKKVGLNSHGGRDKYVVALPVKAGRNRFRLGVDGGGLPTPNDPRILNFRAFRLEWKPDP